MIIDDRTKEILSTMTIDGNTGTITEQLSRKEYVTVNEALETLGGTWNRKQKCHVWTCSPNEALKVFIGGEQNTITTTLETKKEQKETYQCFFTPPALADRLVELACISEFCNDTILEPSAGQGAIVKAITRVLPDKVVNCYEILEANRKELATLPTVNLIGEDFLKADTSVKYSKVIMNPPFQKHQDQLHIQKAYSLLADNGLLVAIASWHSFTASHKADAAFRQWLENVNATVEDIEAGAFSESGTEIPTKLIVIDKG